MLIKRDQRTLLFRLAGFGFHTRARDSFRIECLVRPDRIIQEWRLSTHLRAGFLLKNDEEDEKMSAIVMRQRMQVLLDINREVWRVEL